MTRQHTDELSKRSLSLFCERDDMDRLMIESYSSVRNFAPTAYSSHLHQIQLGVLLFIETWLQNFPEDFLLVTARINSKFSRTKEKSVNFEITPKHGRESCLDEEEEAPLPPSHWIDDSDDTVLTFELIKFLRGFSSCSLFFFLGGRVTKVPDQSLSPDPDMTLKRVSSNQELTSMWIPHTSHLKTQFACLSHLLEIITSEDSLSSVVNQVVTLSSPKSEPITDESQTKHQSIRSSFFDKYLDSRLSDILEFEDETLSQLASETKEDFQQDFVTRLLTSSLGPEERLSNGCTNTENYPIKIACDGGILNCTISSSLVSALV
jgi:hypothetical protein